MDQMDAWNAAALERLERHGINLRPANDRDAAFLKSLFAETREAEMDALAWNPEMQRAFLEMQIAARDREYAAAYPDAENWIVEEKGVSIGRMLIGPEPAVLVLVDIALLIEKRNRGYGGVLLGALKSRAASTVCSIQLSVSRRNPAIRLYMKEGFEIWKNTSSTTIMKWAD